ncbi:unnamed protein product [Callosobruchus maculatus]|uniref:Uncharacterized protein n=1 Tax=Callosobruchus maculatus TaxID=64391 RepID=A0A653BWN6_CALMS|nr:unnamed protein product [Callosobruchus maculatus]
MSKNLVECLDTQRLVFEKNHMIQAIQQLHLYHYRQVQ